MSTSIRITKPNSGEKVAIPASAEDAGQRVAIGFDTGAGVIVDRADNDLIFRFDNGGESRLTDFFVTGGKELPLFVLEDGTEIAAADVLASLNSDMDLATAAGPGSAPGSGGTSYDDNPGSLAEGLDGLGTQGTWYWDEGGEDVTELPGALNIAIADITVNVFDLIEEDFLDAVSKEMLHGQRLLVGKIQGVDPEGQAVEYGLALPGQAAVITLDSGQSFTVGTYVIDPVSGDLFIELPDFSNDPQARQEYEDNINSLIKDERYSLNQVIVTLSDGYNVSEAPLTPVIIGVNDIPIMTDDGLADDFVEGDYESAGHFGTLTGTLLATDADHNDIPTYRADMGGISCATDNKANSNIAQGSDYAKYGEFVLDEATGTWTFTSDARHAAAINQLADGETVTVKIPVWAVDNTGALSADTKEIVLTITGTNDAPVLDAVGGPFTFSEADYEGAVIGAAHSYKVEGTLSGSDVDLGDTWTFHADTAKITCKSTDTASNPNPSVSDYGAFSVNPTTGEWEFAAGSSDAQKAAFNALAKGETVTITVPVYMRDDSGTSTDTSATRDIVITITGTNDAPVLNAVGGPFTFSEADYEGANIGAAHSYKVEGTLSGSDVDHSDTWTFHADTAKITCKSTDTVSNPNPSVSDYGAFSVNPTTGKWEFTAGSSDAQKAAFNELAKGETVTITVPVYAQDNSGEDNDKSAAQNIVITITGTNDAPTLTAEVRDFHVSEHGNNWNVTANAEASGLFTLGQDGLDVATLFTDVDHSDSLSYSLGAIETLDADMAKLDADDEATLRNFLKGANLNAKDNTFDFGADFPQLDSLAKGQTITITVPVTATDLDGLSVTTNVTFTIHGINDAPVKVSDPVFHMSEHGKDWDPEKNVGEEELDTTFSMNAGGLDLSTFFKDVDVGDTFSYVVQTANLSPNAQNVLDSTDYQSLLNYIKTNITTDGNLLKFSGTLPVLQSLGHGKTVFINVPVKATDSNEESAYNTVQIVIHGINDSTLVDNDDKVGFAMSESGKEWDPSATPEEQSTAFTMTYDAGKHFRDDDFGDKITYSIKEVGLGATAEEIAAQTSLTLAEAQALIDNLDSLFSIDPLSGEVTYHPNRLPDISRLADAESLNITISVQATDGIMDKAPYNETPPVKDLVLSIHGTESGPSITITDSEPLNEPGTVTWWSGDPATATDPNALSGTYTELDLQFSDVDTGDTISVTITFGASSITFTTDHNGVIDPASFSNGTTLDGNWGQLRYDSTSGKWLYETFNKADTLNRGVDGADNFTITARDQTGLESAPATLAVTVTGVDDGPALLSQQPFTHDQDRLILGPYLDVGRTTTLTGTLNLMDVDDLDSTLQFRVQIGDESTGSFVNGTPVPGSVEPSYVFTLTNGTLTITWVPGVNDAVDALGATGADAGAWRYTYEFTTNQADVKPNITIKEPIHIQAYDPDLPSDSVDLNMEVLVVTTQFDPNAPRPLYDVLSFNLEDGSATFNYDSNNPGDYTFTAGNNNVLDNDRNIAKNDAAEWDGSQWVLAPNVSVVPKTVNTPFGPLTINADGTIDHDLDLDNALLKALQAGETYSLDIPYTMVEKDPVLGEKYFDSYLVITFDGANDAPEAAQNIQAAVYHGSGDNDNVIAISSATTPLATDVDGDSLTYTFFKADGSLVSAENNGQSTFNPADFNLSADFNYHPDGKPEAGKLFTQDLQADGLLEPGCMVYNFEYGWLIEKSDGTYEFVVNRNNPDVIKLKADEPLTFEIKFTASDGSASDDGSIQITIKGSTDKLAVKAIGDGTLSTTYFDTETVVVGTDENGQPITEEKAVFTYGATRGNTVEQVGTDEYGNPIYKFVPVNDEVAINNPAYYGGGGSGQMGFQANLKSLAQSLDGDGSQTYNFALNGTTLYGKDANTGDIVRLGVISVSNNNTIIFYPENAANGGLADWAKVWGDKGYFTEFYTNAAGTTPLTLTATSTDNKATTTTTMNLDFVMRFMDDSPVVDSIRVTLDEDTREAVSKVNFHDVDNDFSDLTLWVQGPDGNLVKIDQDNTQIQFTHGTLYMDTNGEFRYDGEDGQSGAKNVIVIVDDGNSATKGIITLTDNSAPTVYELKPDTIVWNFSSNNVQNNSWGNTANPKSVFGNDLDGSGNALTNATVLNAGTYVLSDLLIKAGTSSYEGSATSRLGGALAEVAEHFSLPDDSRWEMRLDNFTVTVETDGSVHYSFSPSTVRLYDTIREEYYTFHATNGTSALADIAVRLGMDEQELRDQLRFVFEYKAEDAQGEVVSGDLIFDWGNSFKNSSQYYYESYKLEQNMSGIRLNSAFDGNQSNPTDGELVETQKLTNGSAISIFSDLNGDSCAIRYATYDANGNATWQDFAQLNGAKACTKDFAEEYGFTLSGNTIVPTAATAKALSDAVGEIPVYAWVKNDGSMVQTATPSSTSGWTCVQVGTTTWTPTSIGSRSLIGYDAAGEPIYTYLFNNMVGSFSLSLYDAEYSDLLGHFHDYIRSMSEDKLQNLMFFKIGSSDRHIWEGTGQTIYESTDKMLISVTGTDVILGDNNMAVELSKAEDLLLRDGLDVKILDGAKHTVVSATGNSTSRTDSDGWDRIDFTEGSVVIGSTDTSRDSNATDNPPIEGKYGQLVWNAAAGKYVYEVYADADARGDGVRGLVDGQQATETFNYTVYDKNGEYDSGQTVITIDGKSDGVSFTISGSLDMYETGGSQNVFLAELVQVKDFGSLKYYIEFTDPETGFVTNSADSTDDITVIQTRFGTLSFSATTGNYSFTPSGVLQEGEMKSLGIMVKAVLSTTVDGVEKTQESAWTPYDIQLHGVNDAPIMPSNFHFSAANGDQPSTGALAWSDVDNDVIKQAGEFFLDAWHNTGGAGSSTEADPKGFDVVQGKFGTLELDTATGSYTYLLDDQAFSGGLHRVIDEFNVKVQDPGNGTAGTEEWSNANTLKVYGVDGGYHAAGSDAYEITDNLAHIIHGGDGDDFINLGNNLNQENILIWSKGDQGTVGHAAVDTIINFKLGDLTDADSTNDGNILDLRDLLSDVLGSSSSQSVNQLLSFKVDGGNTTININAPSDTPDAAQPVQQIVLQGVALDDSKGTDYDALAQQILLITS